MKLILSVTSEQRTGMGQNSRYAFSTLGGSIGRAEEADWVLPDMNRIVSKKHAAIEFRDGGFFLTDISTNGVFLNEADDPLGYNNAVRLRDGDRVAIGEYKIIVAIESTDRLSAPIQDHLPRSVDVVMCDSAWHESKRSEPLPLGLNLEDGLRLESRPLPLPDRWDASEDEFSQPASQPDHTPAISDAFSVPPAHVEHLPEDWDKVAIGADSRGMNQSSPQKPFIPDAGFQPSSSPHQLPDHHPDDKGLEACVAPSSNDYSAGNSSNSIDEFLRGAGLDPANARADYSKLSMERLGGLYREMVQGVMDVLIARSSLKNEFRMAHTIIRPTENNPLKFSMGVDDALEYLFFKEGEGFLQPEVAFREAYQDIKEHQFATVVGMRAAFNTLMRMFAPERLQSEFNNGKKRGGLLSRNKNAANWQLYEEWYAGLIADNDDQFQRLLATEFGRAYEEEIERLSKNRGKTQS